MVEDGSNVRIDIALSADDNYAQHAAVVIASVMRNLKQKNYTVRFFLLSDGISVQKQESLKATAAMLNAKLDIIDLSKAQGFDKMFTSGHISKAAYFRLALAEILPVDVHKIIYIDVDLLVLDDISKLWNADMQGMPLAAVPDYGIMASGRLMKQKHMVIGLPKDAAYFNSGVLVMDIDSWRAHKYGKQVIELAQKGNLPHHDQDALNKVFMNKWAVLPLRWNVIPPVFNLFTKILFNAKFRKEAIQAKRTIAILHYAGRYKPWEFAVHEGFNEKYYDYLSCTAFAGVKMPQPNNMKGKSIKRQMLRLQLSKFWCKLY